MTGPRSSKRAAKKSKHDSDDGAGPSTSKPKAASVLPPDVASIIVGMLLAEKDRFWDEAELCNVAAKALCVGDPDFTELGKQLYAGLSPRLGMDIDATEKSTAPALKAKLKEWGLRCSGKKQELWQRIEDEITPVSELCPVARSVKRLVEQSQDEYITLNRCKEKFGLYKYELEQAGVKTRLEDEHKARGSKGPQNLYLLKDVKALARKQKGTSAKLEEEQRAARARSLKMDRDLETCARQVTEALIARGVEEDEVYLCVKISGFDGYLNFGVDPEGPEAPGLLQQTTDNVHELVWLREHADWAHTRMRLRLAHTEEGIRARASDLALRRKVAMTYNADKPMSDLTGTPSFPPTLLPKIQALWDSHADKPKPVDVPPLPALPHDYAAWEGMSDDDDDFVMSEGDWAEAFDEPDGWAFEGMEDDSSDYDDGPM